MYKECLEALQDGLLLVEKDFKAIKEALEEAFVKADTRLLKCDFVVLVKKAILATGGVETGGDAAEFILLGENTVQ
ncbi:unnamed protein product [Lupinus luteus]|uniref:Uncharacterized protein n=1 Tax=Lupinus luteus TaxID=3873 RepID=A0AAV1XA47_LUPLU